MNHMQTGESPPSLQGIVQSELPFLRRYGRSICGLQRVADMSVLQVMQDLLVEPSIVREGCDSRVSLYTQLQKNIESFTQPDTKLTPKSRQALLLKDVEGFTEEQAAKILNVSAASIQQLCRDAYDSISRDTTAQVLIIEDELLISIHLKSLVEELGYQVVATAKTETEAIAAFNEHRPNLILSDVQLADGSSGQCAVEKIKADNDVPVVFITAYPERLLTGTCPEPEFLIAKPFRECAVKATISQAYFLGNATCQAD